MKRNTTQAVDRLEHLKLNGNIIDHTWFKTIVNEKGKPNLVAIVLLADVIYWYRPEIIRSESTGHVIEIRKRFKADKLQRSYQSFTELYGLTKRQISDAFHFLEDLKMITLEFRTVEYPIGDTFRIANNVLFIEPNIDQIFSLSGDPITKNSDTPITKNSDTNTETTSTESKRDTKVSQRVSGETRHTSRRSTLNLKQSNTSESNKQEIVTRRGWQEYSPFIFRMNDRFKNMSRMKFPKQFEMDVPGVPSIYPDLTKTLQNAVHFVEIMLRGEFFNNYQIQKSDAKSKFPHAYKLLTSGVVLDTGYIEGALEVYVDYFVEGNWPADKKSLTTNFNTWVFHPKTKKSRFVECLEKYLTGDRSYQTAEINLSDDAKQLLQDSSDMFAGRPATEIMDTFTQWWLWMQPRVQDAARKNSISEEDLRSLWGPVLNDAVFWIDEYLKFLWDKGAGEISLDIVKGGSKWSLGFIRDYARGTNQDWYFSPDEYAKIF